MSQNLMSIYTNLCVFIYLVPGKISSNWFLQDESNLQADTSKKESPPDQSYAPVKLERAGSVGSKKKVQPDGTFVYDVSKNCMCTM